MLDVIVAAHFVVLCGLLALVVISLLRSAFGVLVLSALVWPIMGLGIYPIVYSAAPELLASGEVADFVRVRGVPTLWASFHIVVGVVAILIGFFLRRGEGLFGCIVDRAGRVFSRVDSHRLWAASLMLGIGAYGLFFYLVGPEEALINAAAARGGDFEGFGESQNFLFLKSLAAMALVATTILPQALRSASRLSVVMYFLLIAVAYVNSISRNLLLYSVFVPLLLHARIIYPTLSRSKRMRLVISAAVVFAIAFVVLFFGKVFGHLLGAEISGGEYNLDASGGFLDYFAVLLENFGFQWASVQAGIYYLFEHGVPFLHVQHALAALFGFLPSRVLDFFSLDFLAYRTVGESLACVNSAYFGHVGCTVPPMMFGYAAYIFPVGGSIAFGYAFGRFFGEMESAWIASAGSENQWSIYFLFTAVLNLLTFIPSAAAATSSNLVWLFVVYIFLGGRKTLAVKNF